ESVQDPDQPRGDELREGEVEEGAQHGWTLLSRMRERQIVDGTVARERSPVVASSRYSSRVRVPRAVDTDDVGLFSIPEHRMDRDDVEEEGRRVGASEHTIFR